MIRTISTGTRQAPSRLDSWAFWRDIAEGKVKEYDWLYPDLKAAGYTLGDPYSVLREATSSLWDSLVCPLCEGYGTRTDQYGYYYCLCELSKKRDKLALMRHLQSTWQPEELEDFVTNTQQNSMAKESLEKAVAFTKAYPPSYPKKWVVYSGPTGSGKTTFLNYLMTHMAGWSAYVTATDFEQSLRSAIREDNIPGAEGSSVEDILRFYTYVPILLFDDLGTEYSSPWIAQSFEKLFQARYREEVWFDRITIFTTNLRLSGNNSAGLQDVKTRFTRDGVSRFGSRLMDKNKVIWVSLSGVNDYRETSRTR